MFSKSKTRARTQREEEPEKMRKKQRQVKILGGLAAGVIGGIVATWTLDKYQQGALEATRRVEDASNADPS